MSAYEDMLNGGFLMESVLDRLPGVLSASWGVLLESAPFMLLGFFFAGLLKAFLPDSFITGHLGGRSIGGIVKASLLGIPLPLCSCGVLPAAAGLKKQGAGKGAVTSFLISTPETGIDSIAVTWSLLDPLMTVVRPVVSFVTAVAAGIAVSLSERDHKHELSEEDEDGQAKPSTSTCCCSSRSSQAGKSSFRDKFSGGMRFAFHDLLGDIGKWFLFGVLLSGVISVFIDAAFFERYLSNEYLSMLVMLIIAVPLYVCATASTPIAAALALKGIAPGAVLVFLLAGPATNVASFSVVASMIGRKAALIYLAVIITMSCIAGLLVNQLYVMSGMDISRWLVGQQAHEPGILSSGAAMLLLALIGASFFDRKKA